MEGVIAYFAGLFSPDEQKYARCMLQVAEYLAETGVAAGLEPVPLGCFGFGLFMPGRTSDPDAPYIGVFFDTSDPLYWVQIRAHRGIDGAELACEQYHGVEHAAEVVREFTPRLLAMKPRGREERKDCQRALKTSQSGALENQPF